MRLSQRITAVLASLRSEWRVVALLVVACGLPTIKSVTIPAPVDYWQYGGWYIEMYLLENGFRLPSCAEVLSTGNYGAYWSKACTRIDAPAYSYLKAGLTALSGIDFVGEWQRYFLFTPLAKFLVGYALSSLYTDDTRHRLVGATAIFLVPDYSALYLTQAKGLSFPLLLFGLYSAIRWKRGQRYWYAVTILTTIVLTLFYLPRVFILISFVNIVALAQILSGEREFDVIATTLTSVAIILYLFAFGRFVQFSRLVFSLFDAGRTLGVLAAELPFLSGGQEVPYLLTWPPYIMFVMLPVALVCGASGLWALSDRRAEFLRDERMLWFYSICLTYVPAGIAVGFFWSRSLFELAIPGILVALTEFDALRDGVARAVSDRSLPRVVPSTESIATLVIVLMVVGNLLILPGVWAFPYSGDYEGLTAELDQSEIEVDSPIYTDFKTGAYLVGYHHYTYVYRITDDYDRQALDDIWYGSDATAACEAMRSKGARYFILNRDVTERFLPIENFKRVPIPESGYAKFEESEHYTLLFDRGQFEIYEIDSDC